MTKQQLEHLINRYIQGNATKLEEEVVDQFYSHLISQEGDWKDRNSEDKMRIQNRIYNNIRIQIHRSKRKKLRYFISFAAAMSIMLVSGLLYFTQSSKTNLLISKAETERTMVASSEQRSLLLSDGTYVLLSPGARISYPVNFDGPIRKVDLIGEAWFDVQRDTTHPFQVVSNEVITTVLGTSFSINAHPDSVSVDVTVTSGRVQVNSSEDELVVLEKDDQLVYRSGKLMVLRDINAVKENLDQLPEPGAFKLANVTMDEAAVFLGKRWKKEIIFENEKIRDCPLYASFNAKDSLDDVLVILCGVSNSKYKMQSGKIIIYGKGCNQ